MTKSILSCINEKTEVLKQGVAQNKERNFEGLHIDKHRRIVVREENVIELTYIEFEILLLLAQNAGVVYILMVWGVWYKFNDKLK